MRRIFLVASREFSERITDRGFLLASIGTPLVILVVWFAMGGFSLEAPAQQSPQALGEFEPQAGVVGYVDQAEFIKEIPNPIPPDAFRRYPDVEASQSALEAGEIIAYYVVPPNYLATGEIERVSPRLPAVPPDTGAFDWILVGNLQPQADHDELRRLRWPFGGGGPSFVSVTPTRDPDQRLEAEQGSRTLPFIVTIAVMIPLFTGGSYLFQGLTQEKGNRVMEILLVSLRPRQLLAGKLLGLSALILAQYAIWVAIGLLVSLATGAGLARLLAEINLSASEALLAISFALGGFGLYAALMAELGALTEDLESGRLWVFVLTLPMMVPIYLWTVIANAPHSPVAVALSLFPYSAPVAMLMRMTATAVPTWQLAASGTLLAMAGIGTILLTARLFRVQTLLSGEEISLKRIWSTLRG